VTTNVEQSPAGALAKVFIEENSQGVVAKQTKIKKRELGERFRKPYWRRACFQARLGKKK